MTDSEDPKSAGSAAEPSNPSVSGNGAERAMVLLLGLAILALASIYWPKISVVPGFLTLVAFLSLPALSPGRKRLAHAALIVSVLASSLGFFRFIMAEAIPGVIAGGRAAVSKHTIAYVRTIIAAQDRWREHAPNDPDGDGIGSAATFAELAGLKAPRSGSPLPIAPLHLKPEQIQGSPQGELIAEGAYLFQLCLPAQGGGFTARPTDAIDEELAERRYLLYAWPRADEGGAPREIYFANEHEALLVLQDPDSQSAPQGVLGAPACDAALPGGPLAGGLKPWKDKEPRSTLPGDTAR